jgi:DNA invertase Pin-like site-specific DNA recombinase
MAMRHGYARVSAAKQDCTNQIDALKAAGCTTIFTERVSAKSNNNRTEFKRLMKACRFAGPVPLLCFRLAGSI